MDELNLQEIEKKLNEQFANGQRLIFWYDADASFETEVDRLQLGDVRILHLTENNAFRTKLLLEHEDTEGRKGRGQRASMGFPWRMSWETATADTLCWPGE